MSYIAANLVAIVCATLVGLMIGAAAMAVDRVASGQPLRASIGALAAAVVSEFWLAAILAGALILAPVQANAWTIAIVTPVVIWIGFVVPTLVTSYRFRGLPGSALLQDVAHWGAVMVVQAAVLHVVGLVRP